MNSLNMQAISPTPDELLAAFDAFEGLPTMDDLARLVMVRRAVAAGFYTDNLLSPKQTSRRRRQPAERSGAISKRRRPARTSTSTEADADTDGVSLTTSRRFDRTSEQKLQKGT
jgi:hypothetical protein